MPYNFTHALVGLTSLKHTSGAVSSLVSANLGEFLIGTMGPDPYFGDAMPKPLFAQSRLDLAEKLRVELPEVKVVILTMHKSGEFVSKALCAGVRGYVLKDNALEELIECIQLVSERKIYLSQDITGIVVDGFVNNNRENPESGESAVSPREREILQLLAEGKSNKDISDLLNLSIKTVETHRSNIMRKLGFRHITDLVLYAVRNHMIEL